MQEISYTAISNKFFITKWDPTLGWTVRVKPQLVDWLNQQGIAWEFGYPHLIVFTEQDKTAVLLQFG